MVGNKLPTLRGTFECLIRSTHFDMDLSPFQAIDPCGYPGLSVTQTRDLGIAAGVGRLGEKLAERLLRRLQAHGGDDAADRK